MTPSSPAQVQMPDNAPTPPPVFASDPLGRKPKQKSTTPTVIGGAMIPTAQQAPSKTLLGQ